MYLSIYIYFSKFIESLFPTPVLKPLNKKKQHIPCQDLKKKHNHLWLVVSSNPYMRCFETEQSSTPKGSIPTTCRCGRSSPDTAATPAVPPVAPPVGDTGAAPVPSGGTSQARSSLLGAPWGFTWCCSRLVSLGRRFLLFTTEHCLVNTALVGGYLEGGMATFFNGKSLHFSMMLICSDILMTDTVDICWCFRNPKYEPTCECFLNTAIGYPPRELTWNSKEKDPLEKEKNTSTNQRMGRFL